MLVPQAVSKRQFNIKMTFLSMRGNFSAAQVTFYHKILHTVNIRSPPDFTVMLNSCWLQQIIRITLY